MGEDTTTEKRETVRVAKAYTTQIAQQQTRESQQLRDAFDDTEYEELDLVKPPYDLEGLAHFLEVSTEHARCVKQKALDTIAGGSHLKLRRDVEVSLGTQGLTPELRQQHDTLSTFFGKPNEEMTEFELLECFMTDYDSLGNAYMEVVRGTPTVIPNSTGGWEIAWGPIKKLYHIPAKTMRVRREDNGYVQKRGIRKRWFKKFGDGRLIDATSGEEIPMEKLAKGQVHLDQIANEVINLKNYHPRSDYYGIPDFVPSIGAIIANLNVRDYNISYFDNSAVPLFAVILEGAEFDEPTRKTIENFFQQEVRGTGNAHKTLILEIPSGRKDEQPSKITLTPLQPQVKDGYFTNFRRDNRDEIIRSHNMPPFRIGIIEVANIGTGTGTAQLLNYQQSVVLPRQRKIEYRINNQLVQSESGFGFADWVWELKPVDISEKERMALVHERYGKLGVMTINEIRSDIGLPKMPGGDIPFVIASPDKITLIPDLANRLQQLLQSQATAVTPDPTTGSQEKPSGTPEQSKVLSLVDGSQAPGEVA